MDLDLDKVARDDPTVYKMIRTTNTLGLFQIESPGQRELTGKHQPTKFNDLTMQISLFRPGPMKGNMIKPYLDGQARLYPAGTTCTQTFMDILKESLRSGGLS